MNFTSNRIKGKHVSTYYFRKESAFAFTSDSQIESAQSFIKDVAKSKRWTTRVSIQSGNEYAFGEWNLCNLSVKMTKRKKRRRMNILPKIKRAWSSRRNKRRKRIPTWRENECPLNSLVRIRQMHSREIALRVTSNVFSIITK